MTTATQAKHQRAQLMRQVPVGGVFLVVAPGNPCPTLYMRVSKGRVACFVNALGELPDMDDTTRISRDWFVNEAEIVLLPEAEQARRIMLAHHGLGAQVLEVP